MGLADLGSREARHSRDSSNSACSMAGNQRDRSHRSKSKDSSSIDRGLSTKSLENHQADPDFRCRKFNRKKRLESDRSTVADPNDFRSFLARNQVCFHDSRLASRTPEPLAIRIAALRSRPTKKEWLCGMLEPRRRLRAKSQGYGSGRLIPFVESLSCFDPTLNRSGTGSLVESVEVAEGFQDLVRNQRRGLK